MKDESQQQVPPGIVAFKNIAGGLMKFDESGVAKYEYWVNWRMQEPNTIHTISVDGKEYSVGDQIAVGSYENIIEKFQYQRNKWFAHFENGDFQQVDLITDLISSSKLPPATQPDRSQPGKEEDGKLKAVGNAISALMAADKRIYELESELADIKSKPTAGWNDEDLRSAFISGKFHGQKGAASFDEGIFKTWLSTYKQTNP